MTTGRDASALLAALEALAARVRSVCLPLDVADAAPARQLQRDLLDQLDDYVLPRVRQLDAPLLAVVGGPTGAGKSTLVNSLVGTQVSAAGVLRPTTRSAVLACHPGDVAWFADARILPTLTRTDHSTTDPASLQLVPSEGIPRGLALLDAPDIDSVVTDNRALASQLMAAADMWLFVTSAARYADAVPWEFLSGAVTRGTAVAVVLDRVAPEAVDEVRAHLATMLTEHGLGSAPLFVVPETTAWDGVLAPGTLDGVRSWLHAVAGDATVRGRVVRHTLDGAVRSLGARVFTLAAAADEQAAAVTRLRAATDGAYDAALERVDTAVGDGSLLRGEVMARWQEFVGTGELMRSLEARISRVRDLVTAAARGRPQPGDELAAALETGVESLVRAASDEAAETAAAAWAREPAGRALLGDSDLHRSSPDLAAATERAVREWQGAVLHLVRDQAQGKRATARRLAYGVNGLGLLLMIVVFAHTGGLVAGEVVVAGGASALSQKILEAVLGDQAVRSLAASARGDLHARVARLVDGERARYLRLLSAVSVDDTAGAGLRAAVQDVEDAR